MWMNLREIFRKGLKPVTLNNASDYRTNGLTDYRPNGRTD